MSMIKNRDTQADPQFIMKIVFVGDSGVGKTSLIGR